MFKKKIISIFFTLFAALFIYSVLYCSFRLPRMLTANALSSAQSMITIEASTRRILYSKAPHRKLPEASTTKIATAITVLEHVDDLQTPHKIPKEAVGVEGSSIYLGYDEELSVMDLLYGLMLQSGNDCAVALAVITAGSVEKFAALMNETAAEAGAKDTNFVNPHGLHDDNHYTTAYDLAMITAYAMRNETFKKIVSTKTYRTERGDHERIIVNKNKILSTFEGGDGVKTGYTRKAGRCLVSSATRNGMQIISVVLNDAPMFEDCAYLMQKAFNEFERVTVIEGNKKFGQVIIDNCKTQYVDVGTKEDIVIPLTREEKENLKTELVFDDNLPKAPLKSYTKVGKIKIYALNHLIFETDLYNIEEANPLSLFDYLKELVGNWNL